MNEQNKSCKFFSFLIGGDYVKTPRIQLSYDEVIDKNRETVKVHLPKNYRASEYFKFLPCFHDVEKQNFKISISDVINK